MNDTWKNNSIGVKVASSATGMAMLYLFFFDGESFAGWSVFFISLVLTILFKVIQDRDEEIEELKKK